MRMPLAARLALAGLSLTCAAAYAAERPMNRDAQWIYRERNGDGGGGPSATFLSWNYTGVVLQARCERSTHIVTLVYPDDAETNLRKSWDRRPLVVVLGTRRVVFKSALVDTGEGNGSVVLEGTLKVTPKVLEAFAASPETQVSIEAPEEEYGEWFVGRAEPLRRLIKACA